MAGTRTPHKELYKPIFDEEGWDDEINANFDTIDTTLYDHDVALSGKAGATHTHAQNDISGLEAALAALVLGALKSGMIVIWKGSIATIPSGFVFCNGSNNTPDLRGKFVLGAQADSGKTYNVNGTGGEETHLLTGPESGIQQHTHPVTGPSSGGGSGYSQMVSGAAPASTTTGNAGPTNASSAHNNMPPFYVLAYIMKT